MGGPTATGYCYDCSVFNWRSWNCYYGMRFTNTLRCIMSGFETKNASVGAGCELYNTVDCTVENGITTYNTEFGVAAWNDLGRQNTTDLKISNVTSMHNVRGGIMVRLGAQPNATRVTIIGCTVRDNDTGAVNDNLEDSGVSLTGFSNLVFTGNRIQHPVALGGMANLYLSSDVIRAVISSNLFEGTGTANGIAIYIHGATYIEISINTVYNIKQGFVEDSTANYNTIVKNKYYTVTTPVVISGANTVLETVTASFIKELGTAVWIVTAAAPMGIDIDAANEGALAKIKLPLGLQQVVRIKVFGIAQVAEADGMQLNIAAGSGIDNETWNAEAIAVASKTSSTLNFANLDVIQWAFTPVDDSDIGDLTGGDFLQWCCYWADVVGGNCATDLLLAGEGLEIQYV